MSASSAEAWNAVLAAVRGKPAMSWVAGLVLRRLEGNLATVAPAPGRRDLARFVTPQRAEQVSQLFSQVVGRPVRVQLDPAAVESAPSVSSASTSSAPAPGPGSQWQRAMTLPLVREVVELFDATLVEVRGENDAPRSAEPPAPAASDGIPEGDAADNALFPGGIRPPPRGDDPVDMDEERDSE